MFDKLKQMYDLKRKADQLKKELESEVIDVEVGDVKIRINAAQKIDRASPLLSTTERFE